MAATTARIRFADAWRESDDRRLRRLAAGVCIAVAVARVVLALLTPAPDLVFDAAGYDEAARRLVTEGYYAYVKPPAAVEHPSPNALALPGYVVFLAAMYLPFGQAASAQPLVSVAQALLSGIVLWLLFLLGRACHSARAGLVAVLLAAAYPPFWLSYRYVLTEDLFAAILLGAMLALAYAAGQEPASRWAWVWCAVAGLLGAAALYVRAAAAGWLVCAFGLLFIVSSGQRLRVLKCAIVAALVVIVCFTPWWYRNQRIYGAFVPLNTDTASGSLMSTYEDRAQMERDFDAFAISYVDPAEELEANGGLAQLAAQRTRESLADDPLGFLWRRLRALGISVFTYHPNPFGGFTGWGGLIELVHLALLGLAARGAWLYRTRRCTWVLLALPLSLVLLHAATLAFSRYLFPMMPAIITLAAWGLLPALQVDRVPDTGEATA